jgi:hypothetical protein
VPVPFTGEAITDLIVGLPKNDNKITTALTYEGMPAARRIGRTGLQSTSIEAGNGPLADAGSEATTFESVLYTVLKIPQIASRIRSGLHPGVSAGVPLPNHL